MMHLHEFLEAIEYKIATSDEYLWDCYGPNARSLDCEEGAYTISCVFDNKQHVVYEVTAYDYDNDRAYQWIDSDYVESYDAEASNRGLNEEAFDDTKLVRLDVLDDMLEKIEGITSGADYDTRVTIQVDIPKEDLYTFMLAAHAEDVTLNKFFEMAIRNAIG